MGFEVFEKGSAPRSNVPTVTIQRRGLISLNQPAHALIGSPDAVELLWDADRRIIGLRPTASTSPNAYPARSQSSTRPERGPFLIAGNLFARYIGIDTSEAFRWVPVLEDGILCIDLNSPGQRVRSNRTKQVDSPTSPPESPSER